MTWLGAAAAAVLAWQVAKRWPRWRLRGRTALVTGGSRGLGLAVAQELLRAGARVAFCARDAAEVERAAEHLSRFGPVLGQTCDVTDGSAVEALAERVAARFGPIEVLVNNAGEMMVGPLAHMTRADFDDAMAVHYGGALNAILAVLPGMRARRAGILVNITSIGGLVPVPHMAPYVASKFALVGLSRALHAELRRDGIHVVTVYPGPMRTGSPLGARFKGRHHDEFAWFATADGAPLLSTGGKRAARRVVRAARAGQAEVVIGLPARLLRLLDGIAPGVTSAVLSLVERYALPAPGGIGERAARGAESTGRVAGSWVLARINAAADHLQDRR